MAGLAVAHTVTTDAPDTQIDATVTEVFHHDDPVPFVYWRSFSGAKSTVLLVATLAVLSFITGLSHLSQGAVSANGPLAPLLPASVAGVVQIAGIPLAFLLAITAVGLQRSIRWAWNGAVVLLPVALLLPLVTAAATDLLLMLVAALTLPLVVYNRNYFDKALDLSPFQIAAMATFVAVQIYGTIGAYVLREQYTGIETWTDAFYYIVVTGTTVGYGDATPVTSQAKIFTLSVLIIGTAAFGVAFGALVVPAIESRITAAFGNMTASELTLLEDHVLVLGYGELTEPLLEELDATADVVVVTPDEDTAARLRDRSVKVLTADPTDRRILEDARADTASGVVAATADDAQNTLAVLAVRQVNPDVRVVAAAHDQRHVDKLEEVGADEVISPAVIGGRLLGRSVLGIETPGFDEPASDAAE